MSMPPDRYGRSGGPVGAEWTGRARQLLRDVDAAEPATDACLAGLVERIGQRLRHKPTLRKDMLTTLIRDWRNAPELQRFRVAFVQSPEEIFEDQLTGAQMRPAFDAAWRQDVWEPRLLVERLSLQLGKRSTWIDQHVVAAVSLHALARWYQRNPDTSEAALLRDLALLSAAQETTSPFTVATSHGRWVGELIALRQDDQMRAIHSARTFLE